MNWRVLPFEKELEPKDAPWNPVMLKEGPPLPGGGSGIPVKPTAARVCTAEVLLLLEDCVPLKPPRNSFTSVGVMTKLWATVIPVSISGALVAPARTLPVGAFCTLRFL